MPSYNSINAIKMHERKELLDLVKLPKSEGGLGFTGFVVTDYKAYNQVRGERREQFARCMNAGCDLFMLGNWKDETECYFEDMKVNISEGKVSMARLDDAVSRILRVKFEIGLFEVPKVQNSTLLEKIACPEHRAVARQAVRESLVLLKNNGGILNKLKTGNKILVAGTAGDDIGIQCGGWTMCWQGKTGNIIPRTSFLQAVKKVKGDRNVAYEIAGSLVGDFAKPDIIFVCVGEPPYAEWQGDVGPDSPSTLFDKNHKLQLNEDDVATLGRLKINYPGVPVAMIIFSGRPMIIRDEIQSVDALIAAWLPGGEAEGITDVIFGDYDFKGKLPLDWPLCFDYIGDKSKPLLFKRGYGLTKDME
jgi:beta-glucosidase